MTFTGAPVALSPDYRTTAITTLADTNFDVIIIGGGITGAGCALDAATRGLNVALVEQNDWASGTSSRSSKLIHGGLRYLEMMDFGLVKEALQERALMLDRLCPHLVRPVPFLYPLTGAVWERPYVGAGLTLYDTLGITTQTGRGVPGHKHLSKTAALKACPAMHRDALVGAIQYYDAQVDDARHTTTAVRTAAHYGAIVLNHAKVTGFDRASEQVVGVHVQDQESGENVTVAGRYVVNATGVWTNELQDMLGHRSPFSVRASKGVHLLVPKDRIQSNTGLILRTERSVLFVIPWGQHWLIGTTDTEWDLPNDQPVATATDIQFILDRLNEELAEPLRREDVTGVFAGLRPLLSGTSEDTTQLSREHLVAEPVPGMVVVAGGKYTTYRVMAAEAIDQVAKNLPFRVAQSCTEDTPLLGADGYQAAWNARHRSAEQSGVHVAYVEHLLQRYGTLTAHLLALITQNPNLAEPLDAAPGYLAVEVVYAVHYEGARSLADVLQRRTRISFEVADGGVGAAAQVAALIAPALGWSPQEQAHHVAQYRARVAAENHAYAAESDTAALAAVQNPELLIE